MANVIFSQGKGAGNMTCKMEESMSITTEIPSVSIQIIILKLCFFYFSYAIMYRIQGPKHIIVFATNQSSCCQTCGNSTKRKGKKKSERERENVVAFSFLFLFEKETLFFIYFYWSIVALQYWLVSAVQQSESAICLHIPPLFLDFLLIYITMEL